MDGNKLSGFVISLTLILLMISVVSAIPPLPTEFYGSVYVNGNPAPVGTIITATIGGEVRGSFTTSEVGLYGGTSLFDDLRLIVSPTEDDVSNGLTEIAFLIGDKNAEQTAQLIPGESQQLDLSIGEKPEDTHIPIQTPTSPPPATPDQNLIAAFTADITAGSKPLNVAFTDLSTGDPNAWMWEFGDETSSTEKDPVHTYQEQGLFDVTLAVSHEENEDLKTESDFILVTGDLPPPVAMFEAAPLAGSVPLQVAFTDISIGPPTTWMWEFGDGASSTEKNPTHIYTTAGLYSVTLRIENEGGGSNSITREHYISASADSNIIADFTAAPTAGVVPFTVKFRDLSSGNPTMWHWDFGDGQSSMSANPEHTYTAQGVYTVSLTASSRTGETDTVQKTEYITASSHPVGLMASFTASPTGGTAPVSVEFRDTSIGNPTMWYWEFGDGQTATIANPKHIYTAPGTYTVKLTVSNQVATDSIVIENAIVVTGVGPGDQVDFVASPTHGILPLAVQFTDISSCNPIRWLWEFGDGAISTEQNPRHVYKNAGAYTVKLRVTDNSGVVHEVRKQGFIHIQPAQPGSYGKIEISLAPDRATIILNGAKVGETAFLKTYTVQSVPPGTHQLRLVRDGFEDFNKEITVLPGGTTKVEGKMRQAPSAGGTISVSTSPDGAQVFLDGLSLGASPIWKPGVSVGPHTLTVTAGSYYDWAREIYVSDGGISYVTAVLFPQWWSQDTGVVMISSIPGAGTVFVDGVSLGQTPVTVSELEAGEHTVRIELFGHEPWEDTITVHKGRTSYVVATLGN